MSSAPAALTASLAHLLSLDVPTVEQQLMPYLASLSTSQQVRAHLSELLPQSTQSDRWKDDYERWRGFKASYPAGQGSTTDVKKNTAWGKPVSARRDEVTATTSGDKPSVDRQALERQFGNTGKVYIKSRGDDDDAGWGGVRASQSGSAKSSRPGSGRASPNAAAPSESAPTSAYKPTIHTKPAPPLAASTVTTKGKGKVSSEPLLLDLSEQAAADLLAIDRALRSFSISDKRPINPKRVCFCQGEQHRTCPLAHSIEPDVLIFSLSLARRHPLSPFVPICPSCALVICSINAPTAPCPSCARTPLLSTDKVGQHVARLRSERDALVRREQRRVEREREQEARERAAMRFPELGGGADATGSGGARSSGGVRNYAEHAGGTGGRIDRAIRAAHAGQGFGSSSTGRTNQAEATSASSSKVLRLDMKTKKVKIQTKAPVKASAGKGKAQADVVDEDHVEDEFEDAWIDESDDGWRAQNGKRSDSNARDDQVSEQSGTDSGFFANKSVPVSMRPMYIQPREAELMEGGDVEAAVEAPTVALALLAAKNNRVVPGAAPQVKDSDGGGKAKKSRGASRKSKAVETR